MIQRARSAEAPQFCGQNQALELVAMRPPSVPKLPEAAAGSFVVFGQVRRSQKSRYAKQHRFDVGGGRAQGGKRQTLREQGERKLVLLVAKRSRDLLKQGGIAAVSLNDVFDARRFALKPELRSRSE